MRILHLSDLHFDPRIDFDQNRILRALRKDIAGFQRDRPVDAVVFTGDLVQAGTSSGLFHEAIVQHLWPLLEEDLGLSLEQLVVVPGNHDIDRNRIDIATEGAVLSRLQSEAEISAFLDDPTTESLRFARLANFFLFVKDTWPERLTVASELGYVAEVPTANGHLRVLCANSAWRATGQPNDLDRHTLLVGQRQLDQLRRNVTDDVPTIFACHHSPDWLADFDARVIEREMAHTCHVALFGHTHHAKPLRRADEYGDIAVSNAGALFAGSDRRNTYVLLDLDLASRKITFTFRAYTGRDEFAPDTEISNDGLWVTDLGRVEPPEPVPLKAVTPIDSAPESLKTQLNLGLKLLQQPVKPDTDPSALLIQPPVASSRATAGSRSRQNDEAAESLLENCLSNQRSLLVFGERERGKSAALNWLLHESINRHGRRAVLLDFSELSNSKEALLRIVRNKLLAAGVRTNAELTNAPPIAIGIDNFNPLTTKVAANALSFIERHPEITFFISVPDDGVSPIPDIFPKDLAQNIAFLSHFGVREIKALTRQLYPDAEDKWDAIADSTVSLLMNQRLPRTPWSIVMILLIFQYEPALKHADVTLLVDKYLDLLLGKWQTDSQLDSQGIDYINRKYFLALLAVELTRRPNRSMSEAELTTYVEDYLSDRGLDVSSHQFIRDLIDRRVLGGSPHAIAFSLGDIYEFFLACAVEQRSWNTEDLLSDKIRYFDAIVHLMAMSRDRREILEDLSAALGEVGADLPGSDANILFNSIDPEAWGNSPELEESREALRKLGESAYRAQTEEARDAFADEMLERGEADTNNHSDELISAESRNVIQGFQQYYLHLFLLSLCLDRAEHVPDQELKQALLAQCIRGYTKLFIAMKAMAQIYEEEVNTELTRLRADSGLTSKRIDALVEMGAFWQSATLAISVLADQKLRRAITGVLAGDALDSNDLLSRLLGLLLAVFAEAPIWKRNVDAFLDMYGEHPHVHRLIYRALALKFYDRDTPNAFASEIAEVIADLGTKSADGRIRRQARQEIIDQLQRTRVLILRQPLTASFDGTPQNANVLSEPTVPPNTKELGTA